MFSLTSCAENDVMSHISGLNVTWSFFAQCLFAVPMSAPQTVIPQCFAKAGKMEPNHLLNGFGPLQPAVAML